MEDPKMEAVIAKIRKLLAMADGNANEHEAAVAASKAQELLEAYNLDMAIIGRKTGTHAPRNDKKRAGGLYKWQRDLWFATATLNFCKYYYFRGLVAGSQYEHQLIGSHVNVVSTEVMANWFEWFYHRDKGMLGHSFEASSLRQAAFAAAAALGLEIFGGDAIIQPDGDPKIVDINAWPSFARYRDRAAQAIADHLTERFQRRPRIVTSRS